MRSNNNTYIIFLAEMLNQNLPEETIVKSRMWKILQDNWLEIFINIKVIKDKKQ